MEKIINKEEYKEKYTYLVKAYKNKFEFKRVKGDKKDE